MFKIRDPRKIPPEPCRVLGVAGVAERRGRGVRLGASGCNDYARSYRYTHARADSNTYTHPCTDGNADSYAYRYTHSCADSNTYTHTYTHTCTDGYADSYTYPYPDTHACADSYAYPDTHACADSYAYPDTHAHTTAGRIGGHPHHRQPRAGLVPGMVAQRSQYCVHL